jgi:hypothetical protein
MTIGWHNRERRRKEDNCGESETSIMARGQVVAE